MANESLTEAQIKELVIKAQAGDKDAFGTLYDHFFDSIYRYAAFRLPPEIAEDITADIFIKSWEKLHTYNLRKNIPFGAWMFRIARNMVIDTYRSQKKAIALEDELVDEDALNQAEASVKQKYLHKTLRQAMDRLPSKYRDVLQLSYMADMPHNQIAKVLKMNEGAVRVLKFRALKKLEALLPDDA